VSLETALSLRVEHELFIRSFFEVRPPDRMVQQLSASLRDYYAPAGTVLYERGQPSERLYFVISGEVQLEAPDSEPWVLKDLSLLGALDAGQGRPYSRTARAVSDVAALTMAFREYVDLMEDHFDFTKSSMESNARNLHDRCLELAPDGVFAPATPSDATPPNPEPLELLAKLRVLRQSDLCQRAPVQALVSLAIHGEGELWEPGQVLLERGAPNPYLRLVAHGRLEATRDQPVVQAAFGPGSLLLGCSALGYAEAQYRVVAATPSLTVRVLKEDFYDVMEDHFPLAGSAFSYFGRENERTRTLLAEQARGRARFNPG
jgi:CRP-like cAMP-binding protein